MVWTDEMTSRWASALSCEIRKFLGRKRDLFAAGVVERTGALQHRRVARINSSKASRARIPRSCLSFALLRLKLMRDIFAPDPTCTPEGGFKRPFPNPVKLGLPPQIYNRQMTCRPKTLRR